MNIEYKFNTSDTNDIYDHLKVCSKSFIPPLEARVNLLQFSEKIKKYANSFEAWDSKKMIGLIAAYFNDYENLIGFITSVSVNPDYKNMGIASKILKNVIDYAIVNNFKEIKLEVNFENFNAIKLYKKFSFFEINSDLNIITMSKIIKY